MLNATQKKYQKHKYARSNLFATQTKSLIRKFYTVQYLKKINSKRLIAFNINYQMEILIRKVNMLAVNRRRLRLNLSLYRYHSQINNAYKKKVCLAIIQIIRNRQMRLTYIFYELIKEVINLVKLLEKNEREKVMPIFHTK